MGDAWLDAKLKEVIAPDFELRAVREALDKVEDCLEAEGGAFRIAQRHVCGSYEKKTMLAGRREADLVLVLSEAPSEQTLEDVKTLLEASTSPAWAKVRYKAVSLGFSDGVKVDVLPVAKEGITEISPDIPPKLTHALSGPLHVDWFKREAHDTPIHPTVRLLKLFRESQPAWRALSSFAIEVLAVELLRGHQGGLGSHFREVLSKIAQGYLKGRVLLDPADATNDVLRRVTEEARAAVAEAAQGVLPAVASETWSAVFQSASAALPSSNLGGRTLA